jgi:hypothetical protein
MTTPPKLLGTYSTPSFTCGGEVSCARRGDVRITGGSDAPIPWPIGQTLPKGRSRSLVLYGDLAEAVTYHWGVKANTVWQWRKALGVTQHNEGTTALKSELLAPVLEKAREAAKPMQASPERRAKISAAKRGKSRPHVIEAMRKGRTGRPHGEEARRKVSEAHRRRRGG